MLLKSSHHVKILHKELLYEYFVWIPHGLEVGKILVLVGETRKRPHGFQASAILKI